MFKGLLRFKNLEHLWIKSADSWFTFSDFNETIQVKHLHLYTRFTIDYTNKFTINGLVFSKLETLDVVYFTSNADSYKFEILHDQVKSPLRAISFSQFSLTPTVLDLAMLSERHSETCEYLDFSRNQFYAITNTECLNMNCPQLKLLDLSFNQLFAIFAMRPGFSDLGVAQDKFDAFTKALKELRILNLSNQAPSDKQKTIPKRQKECSKNHQQKTEMSQNISTLLNGNIIESQGLRRLNIDFFGSDLLLKLRSIEFVRKISENGMQVSDRTGP